MKTAELTGAALDSFDVEQALQGEGEVYQTETIQGETA